METVLTTNNGQMAWSKLSMFGLHSRRSFIGFQRYLGKNSAVYSVDPVSGMKIAFYPAQAPKSERATFRSGKTAGKRGRPAVYAYPKQEKKRGRPALSEAVKAEREALKAELEGLVFFNHPQKKRGRKPGTKVESSEAGSTVAKKAGRKSEADRIKTAKKGDIIPSKNGSWLMIEDGLASWIAG